MKVFFLVLSMAFVASTATAGGERMNAQDTRLTAKPIDDLRAALECRKHNPDVRAVQALASKYHIPSNGTVADAPSGLTFLGFAVEKIRLSGGDEGGAISGSIAAPAQVVETAARKAGLHLGQHLFVGMGVDVKHAEVNCMPEPGR